MGTRRARSVVWVAAVFCGVAYGSVARAQAVAWTQLNTTGPTPRAFHGMAYDAGRGQAVLFGGETNESPATLNGETWVWSGAGDAGGGAWTQRVVAGPSARANFGMAYDA